MTNPGLLMALARERLADLLREADGRREADLLREAERERRRAGASASPRKLGPHYRASDGSWIHGRRDSS